MTDSHATRTELSELRRELRRKQDWVKDDDQLWMEISVWLQASAKQPAGSVGALVRRRLQELTKKTEHKMYAHRGVDEPEEAFPDECKGCPHYSVQCPMTARKTTADKLKRLIRTAEDDDELETWLLEFANRHDCHVIPDALNERSRKYRKLLSKGEELRRRLNAHTSDTNLDDLEMDPDLLDEFGIDPSEFGIDESELGGTTTATPDVASTADAKGMNATPPADAAATIAEVTAELEAEDDEDAEEAIGGAD